ncbi:MAG: MBL fold metallo-hydrolase [Gemmatimonadaceae bacterium]
MKLCTLGSGSKGNAVLIQAGQTRILVDAGFSPRAMHARLRKIGVDPRSIEAVAITHEHTDHAKGAAGCARKWGWKILATAGTESVCASLAGSTVQTIASNGSFTVGDIELTTARTSHDASEPVAIFATDRSTGLRAAIVYDLGVMTEAVLYQMDRVDLLMLESNHDGEMLRNGPYPAMLQRRIAGVDGHLSNRAAARAACECAHRGLGHVVLAHLSEVNNTPEVATLSMRRALARTAFRGVISAAGQDGPSRTFRISKTRTDQLTLGI